MKMYRTKKTYGWKYTAAVLAIAAFVLTLPNAAAAREKKQAKTPAQQQDEKFLVFDNQKIVWPEPPAIARLRFVTWYTGQKIDYSKFKQKKVKKTWMDRLAGTTPEEQNNAKIPYQLMRPYGVAVDSKGNIYTADQGVDAIFIFNAETNGVQLIRNGHEAHFGLMDGLAIDDNDWLFVTDSQLHEVQVFNAQHKFVTAFGSRVLTRPGGIAIDTNNRFIYVVDTGNDVVDVFDADSYKLLRHIGVAGKKHTLTAPGTFSLPTQVAVDSDGNVYVTDTLNDRVEIFDADGNFLSTFGQAGDSPGYFTRPKGIAVDSDGHIWVTDESQSLVQVFNRKGQLLMYLGGQGKYPGQFTALYGIAIDKNNRVVTSEQWPGRLQVFRYVTDAEAKVEKENRAIELKKEEAASREKKATPAAPPAAAAPAAPAAK